MIKAVIFDLDGTLYIGKTPLDGVVEKLDELRTRGIKILFLTNAATRSRSSIAEKLTKIGIKAEKNEVFSGSYLLARYISKNHKCKKVYPVGEFGLLEELKEAEVALAEQADVVAVGLDREFNYDKLARAHINIMNGAEFIVSNNDHTYPTENGTMPGAGCMVSAIRFSTEKTPFVVGKPNPYAIELIMTEHDLKKSEMLMVGDRIDTDIEFAANARIKSALVLSGSGRKEDIKKVKPDFIFQSVASLSLP